MSRPRARAAAGVIAWHLAGNPAALIERLSELLERAERLQPGTIEAMHHATREEA